MSHKPRNEDDPSRGLFSEGTPGPEGSHYLPEKPPSPNLPVVNDLDEEACGDVPPPDPPWEVLLVPPPPNNKPRGLWRTVRVVAASSLTVVVVAWLASRAAGTAPREIETFEAPVIETTAPTLLPAPVAAARQLAYEIPSAFEPSGPPDVAQARAQPAMVEAASPDAVEGTTDPSPVLEERARITIQVVGGGLPRVVEEDVQEGDATKETAEDPEAKKADKEGNGGGSANYGTRL